MKNLQLIRKFSIFYGTISLTIARRLPAAPIMSHMNPVHTFPNSFLKIRFNIILPSKPVSSKLSLPFMFSNQTLQRFSHPHAWYLSHPYHLSWFGLPTKIWRRAQSTEFIILQLSPSSCRLISFRSKYFLHPSVLQYPQSVFFRYCERPSFTPTQNHR
jgi:hypothetical protein